MDVRLFLPELTLSAMALVMLGLSLLEVRARIVQYTAIFAAAVCAAVTVYCLPVTGDLFFKTYRVDLFSQFFKVVLSLGLFLVVFVSVSIEGVSERYHGEYFFFMTTCTLGMTLLVSATELLTLYIALELSSYSLYILVPIRKKTGTGEEVEAGVKYLFFGAAASAVMLFGMSYLFGLTGTTSLPKIMSLMPGLLTQPLSLAAVLMTSAGLMFKLSLFPFHFWAPDVYQGAANQVTTFIATVSKVAAVAVLIRILSLGTDKGQALITALTVLSMASMFAGNLAAIVQKDLKRMLAYSSIAHAGYILIGIVAMNGEGYASSAFYTMGYLVMNFAAFMVLVKVSDKGGNVPIEDLRGLYYRSPILAMVLFVSLISLSGIPPTVGFVAKWYVFTAAMKQGHWLLVVVGAVNSVIALYYYLRVVRVAYLVEPGDMPVYRVNVPTGVLSWLLVAAMIYAGFFPDKLTDLVFAAAKALTG